MIFSFSMQSRKAYTRENSLWGSLLTFLTNELGTECTYIGIIREDLREGMCEESTGWIKPNTCIIRAVGKPPGYFLHLVRNMQPAMRTSPMSRMTRNTVSFPLPKRGPATKQMRMHRETPALTTGGCKRFWEDEVHSFPFLGGPKLLRTLSNTTVTSKGQSCKFSNNVKFHVEKETSQEIWVPPPISL